MGIKLTPRFLKHFLNPKHAGVLDSYDCAIEKTAPNGGFVKVYICFEGDKIKDVGYEVDGCPALIASASAVATLVHGKPIDFAEGLTLRDVLEEMGAQASEGDVKGCGGHLPLEAVKEAVHAYKAGNLKTSNRG